MQTIVIFAFVHGCVYVAKGADIPLLIFPSFNSKVLTPDIIPRASSPIMPDIKPNFDLLVDNAESPPTNGVSLFIDGSEAGGKEYNPESPDPSTSSFLEWSSRSCKNGIPIVKYFAQNFMRSVKKDKKLRKTFQIRGFTAKTLSALFYKIVLKTHSSVGSPDAPISAEIVSKAVAVNFHKVKKDSLLRIFAFATAKYLFYRGLLDTSNVLSLSQQFFMSTKKNIDSLQNPNPERNIENISESFVNFLISLGLFNPYSTPMVAGQFSSEWYDLKCKTDDK